MKIMKVLLSIVLISFCVYPIKTHAEIKSASKKQIIIELDFIPKGVKPGDKPITLNKSLLSRILPELKNPRLMSLKDLDSEEQEGFIEGGYTFVLRGDFDRDGFADIAFVGNYDNMHHPEKSSFIAIVSIKGKKVCREYFSKLENKKVYLIRVMEYKPKKDAIGIIFNLYSEDCGYLFWAGGKYNFKPCQSVF